MMSDSPSQASSGPKSNLADQADQRPATPRTDYPTAPAAITDAAQDGKGTARFLGVGLLVFPLVILLGVIFVAVIVIFAQRS